jgi:AraC-like DNA-binding protein
MKQPSANWTSIAYECGYYDQMHMIKDFKEFANVNPSILFQNDGDFTRPQTGGACSNDDTFNKSNSNLYDERFIVVKRTCF